MYSIVCFFKQGGFFFFLSKVVFKKFFFKETFSPRLSGDDHCSRITLVCRAWRWEPVRAAGGRCRGPAVNSGALCVPTCSGGPEPRPLVATAEHTLFHEEGTGATETESLCGDV